MNVLIIGSGGREHALAWKIAQSPLLDTLYITPGNAGTASQCTNLDLNPLDFHSLIQKVDELGIDLVIVGPEDPLVHGITDYFHEHRPQIAILGPGAQGAKLEGSKDFAKAFMKRHGIPTAAYQTFERTELTQALAFLDIVEPPYVLKVDGLAAGKGVIICPTREEASQTLTNILTSDHFGSAADKVLIEEFLQGIEMSAFILTDGQDFVLLPSAKDYKRIGEGDTGPNTGGMGSISPVPFASDEFMDKVMKRIILPTLEGINKEGIPYRGFIFFGLMKVQGDPYLIEYNARLGDPETESILPRIDSDLLELSYAAAQGRLKGHALTINPRFSATVMMVSGGYPGAYTKGYSIEGLEQASTLCTVFHAGTKRYDDGSILTNGGRVLGINAMGDTLQASLSAAYRGASEIRFENALYRKDLGFDLL